MSKWPRIASGISDGIGDHRVSGDRMQSPAKTGQDNVIYAASGWKIA